MSLSNEFILTKYYLVDVTLDANHQINKQAYRALKLLRSSISYSSWLAKSGLKDEQLAEVLSFLNHTGALRVKRGWAGAIKQELSRVLWIFQGMRLPKLSYRRPGGLRSVTVATLRATGWIWLSWPILLLLANGSGLFAMAKFIAITGASLVMILISLIVHEYFHVLIATWSGRRSSVLQQGLRLGVVHPELPPRKELFSALLCPLLGGLTAIAFGRAGGLIDSAIPTYGILIGLTHAASWLPWYGDGLTLVKIGRSRWA